MRSNNIKLSLLGYILIRVDTSEYLKEIVANTEGAVIAWSTLSSDAGLFSSRKDATDLVNFLSLAANIQLESRQLFRFIDDSVGSKSLQNCFESVTSKYKLVSF